MGTQNARRHREFTRYAPKLVHAAHSFGAFMHRSAFVTTTLLYLTGCVSAPEEIEVASKALPALARAYRVELGVLLLSDGDVGTAMVKAGLEEGLVPYTEVDLRANDRPDIDAAFLADEPEPGVRRAKFQAVVLPNQAPTQLSAAELATLDSFEREFAVRELDAYLYPSASIGLDSPSSNPGYSGPLDGMTATATDAAKSDGFAYLRGAFTFDDLSDTVAESYGYLAVPLPNDPASERSFVPFIEVPIPGSSAQGALVGVFREGARERMVVTGAMNAFQLHQQLLFPGMLSWLTYGVHFGHERAYFAIHIDDFLLGDARWIPEHNCTVGDCPQTITAPDILMTPADLAYLLDWQTQNGLKLDLVWNGRGLDDGTTSIAAGALTDPELRWISHTYTHAYLGCVRDYSVVPWVCASISGQLEWVSPATLAFEIGQNQQFARDHGIEHDASALVTGEHSGLRRAPEEPSDNPGLAAALSGAGIRYIGSDNSREPVQRQIGPALTVPRYPMNIFYNVGTREEEIDEYNWIYTSSADGGSGLCEANSNSTCIEPLSLQTGFDDHILPEQARQLLMHALSNSPRPHYAHQSNLAEDRILYGPLDAMLSQYRALLSEDSALSNITMAEAGDEHAQRARWQGDQAQVRAYIEDRRLFVRASTGLAAPVTLPAATSSSSLERFGPIRSGWVHVGSVATSFELPESVGYRTVAQPPAAVPGLGRVAAFSLLMLLLGTGWWVARNRHAIATRDR